MFEMSIYFMIEHLHNTQQNTEHCTLHNFTMGAELCHTCAMLYGSEAMDEIAEQTGLSRLN